MDVLYDWNLHFLILQEPARFMHMLYYIPAILFTRNGICICLLTHACMDYIIWVCMNLSEMCCWFNHHFALLANSRSSWWCIFARVFPFKPSTVIGFQGVHSSQPSCVRTSHALSLTRCNCHTLDTNRVILLVYVRNRGQGITIQPIAGTPTPNGLRSNWGFLLGRSPYMLAGPSLSTYCFALLCWYRFLMHSNKNCKKNHQTI